MSLKAEAQQDTVIYLQTSVICFPRYNTVFLQLECIFYPNTYLNPSRWTNSYLLPCSCPLNFASINDKCRFGDIQCYYENVHIFFLVVSGLLSGSKSEKTSRFHWKDVKNPHTLLRHQILLIVVPLSAALLLWWLLVRLSHFKIVMMSKKTKFMTMSLA